MGDNHDYLALDWVKGEIEQTLKQAQQSLEAFVENPEDSTRMRFCLTYLHQVYGTLQMVEFYGAALLAEEMEKLAQAILGGHVVRDDEAKELLMRAILQLPNYLDKVKAGRRDHPVIVLPLLNDLRAARGDSLLSETALFKPDLESGKDASDTGEREDIPDIQILLRKIRQLYQFALVGIIRNQDLPTNIGYLAKALARLERLSVGTPLQQLWQVGSAVIEGVSNTSIELGTSIKMLLGLIDRQIKEIAEAESFDPNREAPVDLLKNLLYYVAKSDADSPKITAIRNAYRLEQSLPGDLDREAQIMMGPDREALVSVVIAISEELAVCKDTLDLFVRGEVRDYAELKTLVPALKQIADTLAVLGMGMPRRIIQEQIDVIGRIVEGNREPNDNSLMDVAGALLYVEATLSGIVRERTGHLPLEGDEESLGDSMVSPEQLGKAREAVLRESQAGLETAKEGIIEFIASQWDKTHLAAVPEVLSSVRGGLEMIPLPRPTELLQRCIHYIEEKLLTLDQAPDWRDMDTLADAITSVEYYLERLCEDDGDNEHILEIAEESVAQLGYPLQESISSEGFGNDEEIAEAEVIEDSEFEGGEAELREETASMDDEEGMDELSFELDSEGLATDKPAANVGLDEMTFESEFIAEDEASEESMAAETESMDEASTEEEAAAELEASEDGSAEEEASEEFSFETDTVAESEEPEEDFGFSTDELEVEFEELPETIDESEAPEEIAEDEPLAEELEPVAAEAVEETVEEEEEEDEDDLIDDEVIEIFIEEAGEVLETINEFFPQWQANHDASEPLVEIRRAFHTLKGSGRMVGAGVVGELAWSIENMLNRVIDETIEKAPAVFEIIEQTIAIIPTLVKNFEDRVKAEIDPAPYQAVADELAAGGSVDDVASRLGAGEALEAAQEPVTEEAVAEEVEAEEAIVEEPVEEAEPEVDPVLIDIFRNEALSHLSEVENFLAESTEKIGPFSNGVLRALHTLKGSANMAGIEPIAVVVSPSEKFIKSLHSQNIHLDPTLYEFLEETVALIKTGIEQLDTSPFQPLAETDGHLGKIAELQAKYIDHTAQNAMDSDSYVSKVDPQLVSIFLAEGMDLIVDAADILSHWEENPVPGEQLDGLRNELRMLARSAKSARIPEVEALSVALEEAYAAITDGQFKPFSAFFEIAHEGHEQLIGMMDRLAAGHSPKSAEETILALRGCVEEAIENADTGALEAEDAEQAAEQPVEEAQAAEETPVAEEEGSSPEEEIEISEEALEDDAFAELEDAGELEMPDAEIANIFTVENDFDSENDPELVEIFLEEATDIIESTATSLQNWIGDTANLMEVEELQRDLHTLKGGARLAGISEIGDVAHEMETVYEGLCDGRFQASQFLFDLLVKCHDQLAVMLDRIRDGGSCEPATDLVEAIKGYIRNPVSGDTAAPATPAKPEPATPTIADSTLASVVGNDVPELADEIDPDILEIFLEEADELADGIDQTIHQWLETPESREPIDELQRHLHTLKGGARLAGLKRLGDVSHNFETYLTQNAEAEINEAFINDVQARHDELVQLLDEVKKHIGDVGELIEEPEAPAKPEITPSVDKVVPIEKSRPVITAPETDVVQKLKSIAEAATTVSPIAPPTPTEAEQEQKKTAAKRAPQEMVKVPAALLEELVNLAGETSISRGRVEQEVTDFSQTIEEMTMTIDRVREQLRRLDLETEATILFRHEKEGGAAFDEDFDPLEMDRYSTLNQLSRSLTESASDLLDLKETLLNKTRDTETLLLQQSRINTELQEGLMRTRMVPFSRLTPRLRRIVRQVGAELGKQVDLEVVNAEGELDRTVLERMVAPLEHMLRNAVDHGIETPEEREAKGKNKVGRITLHLTREGGEVVLRLSDDGKGVDLEAVKSRAIDKGLMAKDTDLNDNEIMQFIFRSGFSTAQQVTQISGRGVGMDVVHSEIKQLGGSLKIHSAAQVGSQFTVRLPFTVAVNRALMVRVGDDAYAIPLNHIEGIVRISPYELETYYQEDAPAFQYAGQAYSMRYLGTFVHGTSKPNFQGESKPLPVLLVRGGDQAVALQVDTLIGSREVVVKTVGPQLSTVAGISGATILGDGSVVIILDLIALIRAEHVSRQEGLPQPEEQPPALAEPEERGRTTVMVVDDSVTVRKVTSRLLERNGMDVIVARDGVDAITQLRDHTPDVMLLDIEMPRMDGFEVATLVRHDDRLKELPIIMITSRTGEKHRERAYSIGVNQYMGKPFQESELLASIAELLEQSSS